MVDSLLANKMTSNMIIDLEPVDCTSTDESRELESPWPEFFPHRGKAENDVEVCFDPVKEPMEWKILDDRSFHVIFLIYCKFAICLVHQ